MNNVLFGLIISLFGIAAAFLVFVFGPDYQLPATTAGALMLIGFFAAYCGMTIIEKE